MDWLSSCSSSSSTSNHNDDKDYSITKNASDRENEDVAATDSTKGPCRIPILPASSPKIPPDYFVRSIPHRQGHWAGHVFLTIPADIIPGRARKASAGDFAQHIMEQHATLSSLPDMIVVHDQLHISLSKPFSLQWTFVESFVQQLTKRLQYERAFALRLVQPLDACVLVNDETSRSFWAWPIDVSPSLLRLIQHVNTVLQNYHQPTYYEPPLFHVSVASAKGDWSPLLSSIADADQTNEKKSSTEKQVDIQSDDGSIEDETDDDDDDDDSFQTLLYVCEVLCTFGTTKQYRIGLAT